MYSSQRDQLLKSIRHHAIPLTAVEHGSGFGDLEAIREVIGDARIVALGEATHGTRDFFQLKHRLAEFLISECGFSVFALEASWPESEVVNDYVARGYGDPEAALAGLQYWTWDTEEVLAMIHWLRAWNANLESEQHVRVAGIDARFPTLSAIQLRSYLAAVDPEFADTAAPTLTYLEQMDIFEASSNQPDSWLRTATEQLLARLVANRSTYSARSSSSSWATMCHHARILGQILDQRNAIDGTDRFNIRDRAMARNVEHLLEEGGPDTKVIAWAHNGHVARDAYGMFAPNLAPMGSHLARHYRNRYLAVGFSFGSGSFQAIVEAGSGAPKLEEVTVDTAPRGSLDAMLEQAFGSQAFLLDLRRVDDELDAWLRQELVTRECGAVFTTEEATRMKVIPANRFDVLAFVPLTTRARPNPTGYRPRQ